MRAEATADCAAASRSAAIRRAFSIASCARVCRSFAGDVLGIDREHFAGGANRRLEAALGKPRARAAHRLLDLARALDLPPRRVDRFLQLLDLGGLRRICRACGDERLGAIELALLQLARARRR